MNNIMEQLPIEFDPDIVGLHWFDDSPDPGTPECVCSWCGNLIQEGDTLLRIFHYSEHSEARLHVVCWNEVSPYKLSFETDYEEEA